MHCHYYKSKCLNVGGPHQQSHKKMPRYDTQPSIQTDNPLQLPLLVSRFAQRTCFCFEGSLEIGRLAAEFEKVLA
jgi:hypothetical protein